MSRAAALALLIAGCGTVEPLSRVGRAPPLAPVELAVPVSQPSRPAAPAMPTASLFRSERPSLASDLRARQIGDLLTVRVAVADRAELDNATERARDSRSGLGIPTFFGAETLLPEAIRPDRLIEANGGSTTTGRGAAQRRERIDAVLAARVVGLVPGGLVIRGRQQVRVNHELRELSIEGIVRPEDIAPDNSVRHTEIAEARISYGGRGTLSDVQQPRWGQQIVDTLSPF